MGIKELYDQMYGDNAVEGPKLPFIYRKLKRFEVSRYQLTYDFAPGGKSALDIGCGDGDLLFILRDKYSEVWGVDIVESRIGRIREKAGTRNGIYARVEDANAQLAFEDGSFDTITVIAMLEHVFDPFQLVKECHRLLRTGGTLIVEVPNIAWLLHRIELLLGRLPITSHQIGWDGGHLHYFTRTALKRLLEGEGFRVTRTTCGGIFARPRRIWGALLGADILMVGIKE